MKLISFNGLDWVKHPRATATIEEKVVLKSKDSTEEEKNAINERISEANAIPAESVLSATALYEANKPIGEFVLNICSIDINDTTTGEIVYTIDDAVNIITF